MDMIKKTKTAAKGISAEQLNLIVALCAILISAASFYATYLQADSAEKQVKAMTLPLIQFSHGNYDEIQEKNTLKMNLKNAGIGPAIIKNIRFKYLDKEYSSLSSYLEACCGYLDYQKKFIKEIKDKKAIDQGGYASSPLVNTILAGQSKQTFFALYYHKNSQDFWQKLDRERNKLVVEVCYCSMLDDCYITEKNGVTTQVANCPISSGPISNKEQQ